MDAQIELKRVRRQNRELRKRLANAQIVIGQHAPHIVQLERVLSVRTKELESSNRELENFLYSASHALQSPTRHASGFAALLLENTDDLDAETSRRMLVRLQKTIESLQKLVDNLLALARISRRHLRRARADLGTILAEAQAEVEGSASNRSICWTIRKMPEFYGDSELLKVVFINLLSNAVKFTTRCERPQIKVECETTKTDFVICVRDNGVGFDNSSGHRLFEIMTQLHPDQGFAGGGFGLAIVRRIVNRHNGETWADGSVGKGAAFYFSLPRDAQKAVQ